MNRFRHWIASLLYSWAEKIDVPFPAVYPWVEVSFFKQVKADAWWIDNEGIVRRTSA